MTNAFSSNLNTPNLHLKIKLWSFYKILKVFILKVLIVKRSQKFRFLYVSSDLEYWYFVCKTNTRSRELNLKNTLSDMPLGWRFHAKPMAWGQVNKLGIEKLCVLPCHSCYICGTWKSKEVRGLKSQYGGKGKSH